MRRDVRKVSSRFDAMGTITSGKAQVLDYNDPILF
jgi:hypothetical protein